MVLIAEEINRDYDNNTIWTIGVGLYKVKFHDGTIEMNDKQIILSFMYWGLIRVYPGLQLSVRHVVPKIFTSSTHLTLGSMLFWDTYNAMLNPNTDTVWDMSRTFYEITNGIYNRSCTEMGSNIPSACLIDLLEILNHPLILDAKVIYQTLIDEGCTDSAKITPAIDAVHEVVTDLLYTDNGLLMENGIKHMCLSKTLNKGQLLQLIGPRGYLHDIDGSVFSIPIDVGYGETFKTLYDSAIESRSAARAILANDSPLKSSEYFNREMQLLASALHSISGECCTGFRTNTHYVEPNDAFLLKGKYYMDHDIPVLIWDDIDDLVGSYIEIRTITGCGNPDPQTVCKTCLGWTAVVIPPHANLGWCLTTELCAIITQLILSTKHHEVSSAAKKLVLHESASSSFKLVKDRPGKVFLTTAIAKRNPIIRLDIDDVKNLNDILTVDIDSLAPSRVTRCSNISIVPTDRNGNHLGVPTIVKLEVSGTGSSLTPEVLHYLKVNGWETTNKYIGFQLNDWNHKVPIFNVPNKGDNVQLFLQDIKRFMLPQVSDVKITDFNTADAAISEFISLLQSRLKINYVEAEIFIRACMCKDPDENDYRLPRGNEPFKFVGVKKALFSRSLTGLMCYQELSRHIFNPMFYDNKNLTKHMMDEILG